MVTKNNVIFSSVTIPIAEQGLASAGTFLFILIGAKVLGIEEFGLVALLFNVIMTFSTLIFALVLLPISSSKDEFASPDQVATHSLSMLLVLSLAAVPILSLALFLLVPVNINAGNEVYIMLVAWGHLHFTFEVLRWLVIRYGDLKVCLMSSAIRWVGFFTALAFCEGQYESFSWKSYILLNSLMMIIWILVVGRHLVKVLDLSKFKITIDLVQLKAALPLTSFTLAKITFNYGVISLILRFWNLEVIAALQAFKSIANVFGTISQVIDNHLTAFLARTKRALEISTRAIMLTISVCVILLISAHMAKDVVTPIILDQTYLPYSSFFVLALYGSLLQLVIRPFATKVRLERDSKAFYAAIPVIGMIFFPLIALSGDSEELYFLVFLAESAPIALLTVYLVRKASALMDAGHLR
ncbi:MAG: hypothetical protein P8I13_03435 [Porticoccaceae bacterium]|nr:hypothetical protein [Porticoccaceae bacterium]